MNRVILVGRITKDPELKYTNTNIPVVQFTIAVNRRYQSANGERQADFINCVVWRQAAENLSKYIKKGGLLGVEGQIQTRTYDDPSGQRRYITEVICDNVNFLEPKGASSGRQGFDVNQYDNLGAQAPGYNQQPSMNQKSSYTPNNNYNQGNNYSNQNTNSYAPKNNYNQGNSYTQPQPNNNPSTKAKDPFEDLQSDYSISEDDLPF